MEEMISEGNERLLVFLPSFPSAYHISTKHIFEKVAHFSYFLYLYVRCSQSLYHLRGIVRWIKFQDVLHSLKFCLREKVRKIFRPDAYNIFSHGHLVHVPAVSDCAIVNCYGLFAKK